MGTGLKLILGILFIVALILLGPWLAIWALNTLISSAMSGAAATAYVPQIVFNFWTWLAIILLGGGAGSIFAKSSK